MDKDRNILFATLLDGQLYKYDIGLSDTEFPLSFTTYADDMPLYGSDYLYLAMSDGVDGYSVVTPAALTAINVTSASGIPSPSSIDNIYISSGYGGLDVLPRLLGRITIPYMSNLTQGLP